MSKFQPRTRLQKIFAGEFGFEVVTLLCTAVAGVFSGKRFLLMKPPDVTAAYSLYVATAVAFVALLWRAVVRNHKAQKISEPHALDGVLCALHSIVVNQHRGASVRVCVYVPSNRSGFVHQITNYVGETLSNGRGRDQPITCGIVGLAYRMGAIHYDRLPANTNVADYLVAEYGYPREVASQMRQDRKAWAALPVGEPGAVVAVIYLDSSDASAFGKPNCAVRKALEAAVPGVAEFIARS